MDKVRSQYTEDVRFAFIKACIDGTNYPAEYRTNDYGFNSNSPISWCNDSYDSYEDNVINGAYKLGRNK